LQQIMQRCLPSVYHKPPVPLQVEPELLGKVVWRRGVERLAKISLNRFLVDLRGALLAFMKVSSLLIDIFLKAASTATGSVSRAIIFLKPSLAANMARMLLSVPTSRRDASSSKDGRSHKIDSRHSRVDS